LSGATPAAFTARAAHRNQYGLIAQQQLRHGIEVLLGGGASDFSPAEAKKSGYRVMRHRKELTDSHALKASRWLGIFTEKEFPYIAERGDEVPSLPEMTARALDKLNRDPEGFILLVEGARIDHAGHANEKEKMIREFLEFDASVGVALEFLAKNPNATLFITADHDTGGMALSKAERREDYPGLAEFREDRGIFWISQNHTAEPVVLIGVGAESEAARGWRDNTEIFGILRKALKL
jgi:alkaline phosphatase